ncbi:retrovirus-related pol polyprotein from transposon TNT 1-94 [Tanacetum coccineum]
MPDDCKNYPKCEICGSYDHSTSRHNRVIDIRGGVLAESSQSNKSSIGRHIKEPIWYLESGCSRSMTGVKSYLHKYVEQPGLKFNDKQGTIFNANKYVLDMSSLTPNGACFFAKSLESVNWLWMVENQNDVKVKQIKTDNGTEFRNHKLESFCDEKGISQNFSSPYKPEQNGIAERKNRVLIEAARTMTVGSERIPDISYFHVFGCPVFIHNHKDHLGKFDAKADDGYFLGYSSVSKAFRVYNIRRQQIQETYHVTFDESMEAIRFTNTSVDEIGIDDSSRYPPDEFQEGMTIKINFKYILHRSIRQSIPSWMFTH